MGTFKMITPLFVGAKQGPSAVLSFAIFDSATLDGTHITARSEILVVTRSPATNLTHPNIVSVPTQRIPLSLLQDLRETNAVKAHSGVTAFFSGPPIASTCESGHSPLIFGVESLLARKLGLAAALETSRFGFTASLELITSGVATYEMADNALVEESIEMANIHVVVDTRDQIPQSSESYSHIGWVKVADFMAAVATKDTAKLGAPFTDTKFYIQGLCMASTQSGLAHRLDGGNN